MAEEQDKIKQDEKESSATSEEIKQGEEGKTADDKSEVKKAEEKSVVKEPQKTEEVAGKEKTEKIAEKVEKEIKIPAKFKEIIKQIEEMNVMDLAELVKLLEEKFGVSPMVAATAPMAGADAGESESGGEEQTEFALELKDAGGQKIQVIKVVREITGKGLKESKDLVDKAPQVIKENMKKDEAEEMKKKFEEAGATVALK